MKTLHIHCLIVLSFLIGSCGPSLRETGIPTEGTVLSKRESGRGSKRKFYITVNFFTQPDAENPKPEKPKDTAPKTADEIIEGLTLDMHMGDYQSAEMVVGIGQYDKYNEGDNVKLRYEKGNPTNVIIDE